MARITTNMPDDLKTRIGEAATAEKVSESAWIARACQTVLDGPADTEEILWRDREIATLDRRVQDYEAELKTLRTVVEEIRMVRTRQERIAEEQEERFDRICEGLQLIRSDPAAPQLPAPVEESPEDLALKRLRTMLEMNRSETPIFTDAEIREAAAAAGLRVDPPQQPAADPQQRRGILDRLLGRGA